MQERFLKDKGNLSKLACSLSYPTLYRPPDKKYESALAWGTYAQFFHKSRNSPHLQRNPKYIKTCLFSISPSTFNRTQNKKSESALARGTYAQFFHKYGNGDLDLGTSCFEASKPMKVKKTHTPKNNTNKFCFFFFF